MKTAEKIGIATQGPRMAEGFVDQIERRPDGTHDMTKVFDKRVITPTGEDGEHVLGPRFMALVESKWTFISPQPSSAVFLLLRSTGRTTPSVLSSTRP